MCVFSGSVNKKAEKNRQKKGVAFNELRLPAITSFSSGGRWFYFPLSVSVRLFLTLSVSVNSPGTSVGLGRHRSLSSRLYRSYDVELPEEHHGSLPPDASGQRSQGYRRHGNAKNVLVFFLVFAHFLLPE